MCDWMFIGAARPYLGLKRVEDVSLILAGNSHVYPYFYDNQLTKSPWVVPASHIHAMKPYRRHGLVVMAIEHRMSQLSPTRNDPYAAEVRARATTTDIRPFKL